MKPESLLLHQRDNDIVAVVAELSSIVSACNLHCLLAYS